jgi:hypothetical protein
MVKVKHMERRATAETMNSDSTERGGGKLSKEEDGRLLVALELAQLPIDRPRHVRGACRCGRSIG